MIEKEFESLYLENASLQDRLDTLTEKVDRESLGTHYGGLLDEADGSASARQRLYLDQIVIKNQINSKTKLEWLPLKIRLGFGILIKYSHLLPCVPS